MAKKVKKHSKRKLRVFLLMALSLFAIFYFFFNIVNYTVKITSLKRQQEQLEERLLTLKKEEETLNNELEKLKDPDALAAFARENYLYSKPDEYIIQIDKTKKALDSVNEDYNKSLIASLTIGSIMLIFFVVLGLSFKKKKA